MKNVRFTQSINLSVTIEATVPDDWTDENINDFATDCVVGITIDDPDDSAYNGDGVTLTFLGLDGADVSEGIVWEVSNA